MKHIKHRDGFGRFLHPGHLVRARVAGELCLARLAAIQPSVRGQPLMVTVVALEGHQTPETLPARHVTRT